MGKKLIGTHVRKKPWLKTPKKRGFLYQESKMGGGRYRFLLLFQHATTGMMLPLIHPMGKGFIFCLHALMTMKKIMGMKKYGIRSKHLTDGRLPTLCQQS